MNIEDKLPNEIKAYLPDGYDAGLGTWLVLPSHDNNNMQGINTLNKWLQEQDWYPEELDSIIWFGDDGVGNLLGWHQAEALAVLWNPADGVECWHKDTLNGMWSFIKNEYESNV